MKRASFLVCALASIVLAASASAAIGKGGSMLAIGLGNGSADIYSPTSVGPLTSTYLEPTQVPELNANAEFWHLFADDYAFALQGSYGFSNTKAEPSLSTDPDVTFTTKSFKVRIGGDRVGRIGDRFVAFFGPGVEFWSGKSKFEAGGGEDERENVTRWGLSGRLGGFMMLSENVALMGQIGDSFGRASVEDDDAKTTWWTSSFHASWGLSFGFGGQ